MSSARYKARCRDGDLVAVTFVDVEVGLGLSLSPNNQIARVGGCGGTDHHIHKHTLFYLRAHYKSPELKSFIRHHAHPYIISFLCRAHARGFPIYWPAGMRDLSVVSHALTSHS